MQKHIEEEKRMFEKFDRNKDGFLDLSEYIAFSKEMEQNKENKGDFVYDIPAEEN